MLRFVSGAGFRKVDRGLTMLIESIQYYLDKLVGQHQPDSVIIIQTKVCDFAFNCPDGHDESGCPTFFSFDECTDNLQNCHWKEDFPDKIDWVAFSGKA